MDFITATSGRFIKWFVALTMVSFNCWATSLKQSRQDIFFHKIVKNFEIEMERDLGLIPTASGGRVHDKIEEFEIFFCTSKDLSIEEARVLEVRACEQLLDIINNSSDAKDFLEHYPFLSRDINVYIRLNDQPGEFHNYQSVGNKLAVVCLINGYISYDKCHPKMEYYITVKKESFEEAVKIVQQSKAN